MDDNKPPEQPTTSQVVRLVCGLLLLPACMFLGAQVGELLQPGGTGGPAAGLGLWFVLILLDQMARHRP